ncbi:MAG: DUF1269 domain-containing protein [Burkholderiales bacterium]|nr:DUF1269 domain-containing protein [Burkholderiales bacterium]
MNPSNVVVAVYSSHVQAEAAVRRLAGAGFDMKRISIVGKNCHTEEQPVGYFNAGDRARFFGKLGAFWGGLAGMLFGSAMLFIPVVGHLVILGPIAATVLGGAEGAALGGGLSALVGALTALGVPKDSMLRYETALKADNFLVVVQGDAAAGMRARGLLVDAGGQDVQLHEGAAAA